MNKTSGVNHIRHKDIGSLLKDSGDSELLSEPKEALEVLFKLFNSFRKKKGSKRSKVSVLRLFLKDKNESEHDPGNCRPISLLHTFFKL